MSARRKVMPRRVAVTNGETALAEIEEITLRLENGTTARFRIDSELEVPDDPVDLYDAVQKGHARFAFWAYQAARAQASMRRAERDLARLEARTYLAARAYLESIRPKLPYIEGARVQAQVDNDDDVNTARTEVDSLREHWTLIASVRDAIEHRTHLLRKLLNQDQEANRG